MENGEKKIPEEIKKESVGGSEFVDDLVSEVANETVNKKTKSPSKSKSKKKETNKVRMISATSKVSAELNGVWYAFTFTESREICEGANLDEERADLWNTVHGQVDEQVEITKDAIIGESQNNINENGYNIPKEWDY